MSDGRHDRLRPPPAARGRGARVPRPQPAARRRVRGGRRAARARRGAQRDLDRPAGRAVRGRRLRAPRRDRAPPGQPPARRAHRAAAAAARTTRARCGAARSRRSATATNWRMLVLVAIKLPVAVLGLAAGLFPIAVTAWLLIFGVRGIGHLGDRFYVGPWTLGPLTGLLLCALALAAGILAIAALDGLRTLLASLSRALLAPGEQPEGPVREMLAESLGDRTLSVAYWLPERRIFVDEAGHMVRTARARLRARVDRGRARRPPRRGDHPRRRARHRAGARQRGRRRRRAGDRQRAPEGRPARPRRGAARLARAHRRGRRPRPPPDRARPPRRRPAAARLAVARPAAAEGQAQRQRGRRGDHRRAVREARRTRSPSCASSRAASTP